MPLEIETGRPDPLGATPQPGSVNFALFSEHAERVELCLFDTDGRPTGRIDLPDRTNSIWHGCVRGLAAGQLYGYRVYGPYDPAAGHRFNHHKLLLDPYARMLSGDLQWNDAVFGYEVGHPLADLSFDTRDSSPFVPKCRVVPASTFDWGDDHPPHTPWSDTVIYELNVRGFTTQQALVPANLRGTIRALACEPVLRYLHELGVTAVELQPVQAFIDEQALAGRGLRNLWGYNTVAFFAPATRYLATPLLDELKAVVRAMHTARIEVVLDMALGYTAEGDQYGPTLSFRGIDNARYYRLSPTSGRYYEDFTGCGNTLRHADSQVTRLVVDAMRYWAEELHVDGFRLDLAATLGRDQRGVFDRHAPLLEQLAHDPTLSRLKLIAEPWDEGPYGYQLGQFNASFGEWNDRYRNAIRRYWRGDRGVVGELACRVTGSPDLFMSPSAWPSINYVASHDGFTLADLVSYSAKHNEANGRGNRDGAADEQSWNCGVEGPTADEQIVAFRLRQRRNFLATLFLSAGVPMLLAGDEFGRTQRGNNNAFCQDNEIGWVDWRLLTIDPGASLHAFVGRLVQLRATCPVLREMWIRAAERTSATSGSAVTWRDPAGRTLSIAALDTTAPNCLGWSLGRPASRVGPDGGADGRGADLSSDRLLTILNRGTQEVPFTLPTLVLPLRWVLLMDTSLADAFPQQAMVSGTTYRAPPHSVVLLAAATAAHA